MPNVQIRDVLVEAHRQLKALPAHIVIEAYSVLTRLPSGPAVPPALAAQVLARRSEGPGTPL